MVRGRVCGGKQTGGSLLISTEQGGEALTQLLNPLTRPCWEAQITASSTRSWRAAGSFATAAATDAMCSAAAGLDSSPAALHWQTLWGSRRFVAVRAGLLLPALALLPDGTGALTQDAQLAADITLLQPISVANGAMGYGSARMHWWPPPGGASTTLLTHLPGRCSQDLGVSGCVGGLRNLCDCVWSSVVQTARMAPSEVQPCPIPDECKAPEGF